MIRTLLFFVFVCNMQCSNDFGEKLLFDQSQTREENIEMSDPNEEMDVCRASRKNCSDMNVICMEYDNYNESCIYGDYYTLTCRIPNNHDCLGERTFQKVARCQFCYQTEKWEHTCVLKHSCSSVASPPYYYKTNCTVHEDVICLGNRRFPKKVRCNWTRGHKWSTTLILSITLGGFGADRFYLGHWQEGIGKLFSFGGLGVWTLVDVLLIAIRYLGPADGSFYV